MVWPRNVDFGQIRHGVEWRPAMFRAASISVKCGRGGGPDLASIGDDDIPYIFHKYIAFYAYINCCKTNSSLKRGNEKVAISNINTIISNDIQKVWNIVLAVDKYNSWRSDLSKTEIINDKQFIEYTKNGYATTFTVTVAEPYKRWEFDMENSNMKGHWIGVFIDKGNETQIDFTENVIPKKWFMKPFVKTYLKKQQKQFVMDLKKALE